MEKQKLPNGVLSIILGVFGYLCCCIGGIGFIPAGIGFFLANKAEKQYKENPENYDNYNQIKTAKIIALIALIINILYLGWTIYRISTIGWDELQEQQRMILEEWGVDQ
ncbi:CCC motif membrane protein [Spongiivirga citrea]|uniref:DUF4190 domain-containing protein n=1 Tax=Spongiivirga citrea TaxID=1481457 RepID=A0A6M0CH79_9FLAO|nr:CCC motif membrane protein [Spongiivirga citrea]NER16323.1 hypothetical protein [Spongiivirga citrea]